MSDHDRLSSSQPFPDPYELAPDYPRHAPGAPTLRAAIHGLVDGSDWAGLSWTDLIEALLALGRTDIPLARLAEGHIDAVRILAQAGRRPRAGASYGVWASRSRQTGVAAERTSAGLRLDGTLRFASGAGVIDRALVPVWLADDRHLLVDLDVASLPVDASAWITSAMQVSQSHTVRVDTVTSGVDEIGGPDFYLGRQGFFPGGVGVAACWVGGAARIVDLLLQRPPAFWSPARQLRLGQLRVQLTAAAAVVRSTAGLLDELDPASEQPWHAISTEARSAAAASVTIILEQSRQLAGAAGLAHDEDLSRAHHDLDLYLLQHNRDADDSYLAGLYLS